MEARILSRSAWMALVALGLLAMSVGCAATGNQTLENPLGQRWALPKLSQIDLEDDEPSFSLTGVQSRRTSSTCRTG